METDYKTEMKFEYTNLCTCTFYDEDSDTYIESGECYGDCWEFVLEDFSQITDKLINKNETNWWKISNLRLWDGDHQGFAYADSPAKLIEAMTVNSAWTMRGTIYDDYIEYSLSHHDSPMGSNTTLTIVSEEEREKWGLY